DPPLRPAEVRVRPDGDGGAVTERRAGVDPEGRNEQALGDVEVRRREAESGTAAVAGDDRSLHLRRPPEEAGRLPHLARRQQPADVARRDVVDERHATHVEPETLEQREVAAAAAPEPEPVACGDHLCAGRAQDRLREVLRRELGERRVEAHDESVVHPDLGQKLEPPLERGEKFDPVAEDAARVGLERDRRRAQARGARSVEHAPMPAVDAVERPDRDRAARRLELVRTVRDVHSAASASAALSSRSGVNASGGTASATENGPTSVRRKVRQWPPSATAIARTYVPELTRRSSVTEVESRSTTSSAYTVERRSGISTSTPRRCSRYARSPPIFTADAAGTGSSTSPCSRSSRSSPGASWRSITSPSGSPVVVVAV